MDHHTGVAKQDDANICIPQTDIVHVQCNAIRGMQTNSESDLFEHADITQYMDVHEKEKWIFVVSIYWENENIRTTIPRYPWTKQKHMGKLSHEITKRYKHIEIKQMILRSWVYLMGYANTNFITCGFVWYLKSDVVFERSNSRPWAHCFAPVVPSFSRKMSLSAFIRCCQAPPSGETAWSRHTVMAVILMPRACPRLRYLKTQVSEADIKGRDK